MKTKLAAALSVSGVLVAGSAAALVNTQVLQNSNADSSSATAALTVPTSTVADGALTPSTTITVPTSTAAGAVVSTTTLVPSSTAPASTGGSADGAASTQAVYRIGDAGTVTLDTAGDRLTVVATAPSAGWQVGKVEQRSPLDIEIHFRSATVELEFKANLLFGVVSTSVESRNVGAPPAGGTAAPGPGTSVHHDDDDGDDQHSDDDHDDDHHGGGEHHEDDDD